MKEYNFAELGYFSERECSVIKDCLQGGTYMNFDITWCNSAGNCILAIKTDYDGDPHEVKNFFLHYALEKLFELKKAI